MKEKTIIPTTLLDWPKVIDLLPEQKLLLFSLWAGRYTNGIGIVSNPPLAAMAVSVGLSRQAYETGLDNLVHAKCILWDKETGEICVVDWFRFHVFKGVGEQIARREAAKVSSEKIKANLGQVAPWLFEESYPQKKKNQSDSPPTPTTKPKLFKKQQQAAGASASDEVVVVFKDRTRLACVEAAWIAQLVALVDGKEGINDRAAYATTILSAWRAAGGPPSTRNPSAQEGVVARIRKLAGQAFVGPNGDKLRVNQQGQVILNEKTILSGDEHLAEFLERVENQYLKAA